MLNKKNQKEIGKIIFPSFFNENSQINWDLSSRYISALNQYVLNKSIQNEDFICKTFNSYQITFDKDAAKMQKVLNKPMLSRAYKTFPSIYYSFKKFVKNNNEQLEHDFNNLIS